jgi:hypothetical protein
MYIWNTVNQTEKCLDNFMCGFMKLVSIENVCAARNVENAWQLVVR